MKAPQWSSLQTLILILFPAYSSFHAAIIVDSGNQVFGGTPTNPVVPIVVEISGVASASMPSLETGIPTTTRFNKAIVGGSTVIDGSGLDVLSFGIFSQGRIFLVPPVTGPDTIKARLTPYS